MTARTNNLLVVHGGGPTAVLNCSLVGVIREARNTPAIDRIYGARYGVEGLINEDLIDLGVINEETLTRLERSPGSAIGSSRLKIVEDDYKAILRTLERHSVQHLLFNGGNGTMYGATLVIRAAQEAGYDVNVIGIPKTVDNDLRGTDRSPGYGSAARYVATSVRELGMDVGTLPTPVSILETMGRDVGWLAAASAVAGTARDSAPHHIYLPEIAFSEEKFLNDLDDTLSRLGWAVMVVSEGLRDADGNPVYVTDAGANADKVGRMLPGGVASHLADLAARRLGVRCRSEKPGLCARCSGALVSPSDRADAEYVGREGVRLAAGGRSGLMVGLLPRRSAAENPRSITRGLEKAAGDAKSIPDHFLSDRANPVTEAFMDYLSPVIGADLPPYVTLAS